MYVLRVFEALSNPDFLRTGQRRGPDLFSLKFRFLYGHSSLKTPKTIRFRSQIYRQSILFREHGGLSASFLL